MQFASGRQRVGTKHLLRDALNSGNSASAAQEIYPSRLVHRLRDRPRSVVSDVAERRLTLGKFHPSRSCFLVAWPYPGTGE
ncbi:hypothetical protein PM082_022399 [Marasmius tenuissimus]|nr:hypothetical protein PM082_022399 [Marasmius tenuissimus]